TTLFRSFGVEETNQRMAVTLRHIQGARSGKCIAKRDGRNDLPVKRRLARWRDGARHFNRWSAGIGGKTEAKVLDDLSGARIGRAVVATIPAWIYAEFFVPHQQWL